MTLSDRIQQHVQKLPADLQSEVLDFIDYLLNKTERQQDEDWSDLSLATAMRGMEDETTPQYGLADLKITFE